MYLNFLKWNTRGKWRITLCASWNQYETWYEYFPVYFIPGSTNKFIKTSVYGGAPECLHKWLYWKIRISWVTSFLLSRAVYSCCILTQIWLEICVLIQIVKFKLILEGKENCFVKNEQWEPNSTLNFI